MWSDDDGQAMVEFAFGLPLFLLACIYAFALIDAVATSAALQTGTRRAVTVLASTNDDDQARGAALATRWLRGQTVSIEFTPSGSGTTPRCKGASVTIHLSASGQLAFLLPVPGDRTAEGTAEIESEGAQAEACAALR